MQYVDMVIINFLFFLKNQADDILIENRSSFSFLRKVNVSSNFQVITDKYLSSEIPGFNEKKISEFIQKCNATLKETVKVLSENNLFKRKWLSVFKNLDL